MKPCTNCSPATRFNCDVCEGSGEVPEVGITTRFETVGDDHDADSMPAEAMDTIHEMMAAAMEHRLTMCRGPNPFNPKEDARLLFSVHPDDIEAFRNGQPARKAPLAVLIGQEEVLKMIADSRSQNGEPT